MRIHFVSDLHIWGSEDPLYRSLLTLLRERADSGDSVVLAGDLFDLFVGNKKIFLDRYQEFFEALELAGKRGIDLHYIEGNHDFLIRKAFEKVPGMRVYAHDVQLEIDGKKFFVAHGDTVDRSDYGYRALRLFFRSPIIRAFVKIAPGGMIDKIGKKSSTASSRKAPRLPQHLPLERAEYLRKVYRSYAAERLAEGYDFIVLGHCHDLDEMRFIFDGRHGQYVNIGYPRVHGSYLTWSRGDAEIRREPMP